MLTGEQKSVGKQPEVSTITGGSDPLHNRTLTTEERFREGYKKAVADVERLARVVADPTHFDSGRLEDATMLLSELQAEGIGYIRVLDAAHTLEFDRSPAQRIYAIEKLTGSSSARAAKVLVEQGLTDELDCIRQLSAKALADFHFEFVTEALVELGLKDSVADVVRAAAQSLRAHPRQLREKVGVEQQDEEFARQQTIIELLEKLHVDDMQSKYERYNSFGSIRRFLSRAPKAQGHFGYEDFLEYFNESERGAVKESLKTLLAEGVLTRKASSGYLGLIIHGYQLSKERQRAIEEEKAVGRERS